MKIRNWMALLLAAALLVCMAGCSPQGAYEVYVTDENGVPMSGVAVQLCKDDRCMMAVTDENGSAAFDAQPDAYKVSFLRLPDGYAAEAEEYSFPQGQRRLTIVLKQGK